MRFQKLCDLYDEELTDIENLIRTGKMDHVRVKILELLRYSALLEREQLDSIKRFHEYANLPLRQTPGWKESTSWSIHVRKEIEELKVKWRQLRPELVKVYPSTSTTPTFQKLIKTNGGPKMIQITRR